MGRLINDIGFAFGKKPRTIIGYIGLDNRLVELPFEEQFEQGTPVFRMRVKGEQRHRKWYLIHPPYIDDLARKVFICPYWANTNVDFRNLSPNDQKQIADMNIYFQMALDNEFHEGVEFEKKRNENKPFKKKPIPIVLILVIGVVVMFVVMFVVLFLLSGGTPTH